MEAVPSSWLLTPDKGQLDPLTPSCHQERSDPRSAVSIRLPGFDAEQTLLDKEADKVLPNDSSRPSGILRPPLNRPEVLGYEPSAPRTSTRSPRGSSIKPCREDGRSGRAAARGPWSADRRRIGCSTAYRLFGRSPRGTRTIDKRRILRPPRVSSRFASFHFRAAHACAKNARCRLTIRAGVAGSPGPKGRTQKAR